MPDRDPAYPAARTVAVLLESQFQRQRAALAPGAAHALGPAPDALAIETLIDAAFWASLRREEGFPPRISLACTAATW